MYRNLNQLALGTFFFFCAQSACRFTSGQSGQTQEPLARPGGLQTQQSFSVMQDFRQGSEAVGLSQVRKVLQQLTGQITVHYSSCKIRNTHLSLFHPDQGPHVPQSLTLLNNGILAKPWTLIRNTKQAALKRGEIHFDLIHQSIATMTPKPPGNSGEIYNSILVI